jgi:hypothetical protein
MATDEELPLKVEQWDSDQSHRGPERLRGRSPSVSQGTAHLAQSIRVVEENGMGRYPFQDHLDFLLAAKPYIPRRSARALTAMQYQFREGDWVRHRSFPEPVRVIGIGSTIAVQFPNGEMRALSPTSWKGRRLPRFRDRRCRLMSIDKRTGEAWPRGSSLWLRPSG